MQLTCTVGGVISGYCATGRMTTAMPPASVMMTEMTAAKIGRSMKNFATVISAPAEVRRGSVSAASAWRLGGEVRRSAAVGSA